MKRFMRSIHGYVAWFCVLAVLALPAGMFSQANAAPVSIYDIQSSVDISYLDDKDVYVRDGNTSRKLEGPTLGSWIQSRSKSD